MTNQQPAMMFDKERAPSYDRMWAKLAPTRDAIHLLIRAILADLPADARILCVGVGTGAELLDLAQAFPQWQFTAVEPATPMLDICRQKAEACGITARCTFHEGYVDSLPTSDSFDAATSLLVSHFIMEPEDRIEFFHQIALRLRPQGYLISSDIAYDLSSSAYPGILEIWLQMMKLAGLPQEQIDKMRHVYGRDVAVLPLPAVASIIAAGGFESPVLFFQSLLIHGWYARRNTILQSHG
jgi:tRNA (cmo5U34)-methyltransferase